MKKILLFIFLSILPICCKAYGIENYYIDTVIEEDGDILVQEYFNMTGDFNGNEKIILYSNEDAYEFDPNMNSFGGSSIHNGSGVDILEVRAVSTNSNFSFDNVNGDLFTKTSSASKGDYGVYEEKFETGGKNILIYNPSSYKKAFYIKYRISNIAIKHNDVAEIGWNVIGNNFRESIGNLKIYLHIPGNTNIRAWAHGPINGDVNIIDKETVLFTISNLSSYRAIDIRATFDLDVINKSTKTTGVNALDKIILYETDKAEQANYERQNKEKIQIQNANEALSRFEVNVTRYNYESAKRYINSLNNSDIKTEYLNRLEKVKKELDVIEENEAREALKLAEDLDYYWYERAKEKIEILDKEEVKSELLKELLVIEEELKKKELVLEKKNYKFGFILIIIILVIGYFIYRKYVKDPETEFNHKYFREIPTLYYSPETVSYLFHKRLINRSLSASLMELINRKIITVEKLEYNNYKLKLTENSDNLVTRVESKLLDLIFDGSSTIETKRLKTRARRDYDSFISKFKSYERAALNDAENNLFYENDMKDKKKPIEFSSKISVIFILSLIFPPIFMILLIGAIIYGIIKFVLKLIRSKDDFGKFSFVTLLLICIFISIYKFILILVYQNFYKQSFIVYVISLLLSIILIPFIFYNKKRTKKGAEEYKKWKALKNFLNDFGKFSDKEVPEVALWEKYLVYATLFGCAKKVIKAMKVEMVNQPNDYFDIYSDLYTINRSITYSIRSSYHTATNTRSMNSSSSGGGFSSGGGGGGGFSSGGGSFGGGGGGGRF